MIQHQSSQACTQVSWPDSGKNPGGAGRTAVRLRNAVYYGLVVAIYDYDHIFRTFLSGSPLDEDPAGDQY